MNSSTIIIIGLIFVAVTNMILISLFFLNNSFTKQSTKTITQELEMTAANNESNLNYEDNTNQNSYDEVAEITNNTDMALEITTQNTDLTKEITIQREGYDLDPILNNAKAIILQCLEENPGPAGSDCTMAYYDQCELNSTPACRNLIADAWISIMKDKFEILQEANIATTELNTSQEAWQKYKDAECGFRFTAWLNDGQTQMARVESDACIIVKVRDRVRELRGHEINYLNQN